MRETKEQKLRRQREEKWAFEQGRAARAQKDRGLPLKRSAALVDAPRSEGTAPAVEGATAVLDRITFSAPGSEGWPGRIEAYRKREGLRSTSEAIRGLLEKGLS